MPVWFSDSVSETILEKMITKMVDDCSPFGHIPVEFPFRTSKENSKNKNISNSYWGKLVACF